MCVCLCVFVCVCVYVNWREREIAIITSTLLQYLQVIFFSILKIWFDYQSEIAVISRYAQKCGVHGIPLLKRQKN
jgi:hypothetical protein